MKPLLDACPANVNVSYRMPLKQTKRSSSGTGNKAEAGSGSSGDAGKAAGAGAAAKREISEAAGLVKGKIREEVTDEEIEKNLDNIPIRNRFVRQHFMAICAGIIYLYW